MDRTRRTELRNDAVTVERTDFDGPMLASIHADYVQNMERIGADSFPMAFFEALAEHMDERVEVFTARREGDTLGRHICIVDEEQSASDTTFRQFRRRQPTNTGHRNSSMARPFSGPLTLASRATTSARRVRTSETDCLRTSHSTDQRSARSSSGTEAFGGRLACVQIRAPALSRTELLR